MKNNILAIGAAVVFVVLLALLSDPLMLWMPPPAQMMALLGAAALAAVWAGFVLYEKAHDEREALHGMQAGRVAYLCGVAVLTCALVAQGFAHAIDSWVSIALAVMVVSKLAARLYTQRYR